MAEEKWWKDRVVYQIYPRSFCDTNGDGVGDIPGILSKLDHLQALGVGILWLSPVYLSPDRDNGYDIADYKSIQPRFGTLADMDELIAQCKKRDIKLLMDLVINHTSDQHEWFQKSRRREEPYTDYYIWRPGKNGRKPSNWSGFFGGDCWQYDELRGEYYLHLFAKEQPDLNYRSEAVVRDVEDVMRFWLDRGVSGFRCDVINILWKTSLENGRWKPALTGSEFYISAPGVHSLLHRFREDVFSRYDCFTVGETVFVTPQMADDLTNPARGELDAVFGFQHMETDCFFVKWFLRAFSPDRFFKTLTRWQTELAWNTVYLENHDQPRSVSRFGDGGRYHDQSAKALAVLLLTLRGTAFVYQGQELGMTNFDFADMSGVRDVESRNIWALTKRLGLPKALRWRMIREKSRDNARTPMQWSAGKNAGFTDGEPWLGVNGNYTRINAEKQLADKGSVLWFYRRLIALRNGSETLRRGDFRELVRKNGVYAFCRTLGEKRLLVVINLTAREKPCPVAGRVVLSSCGRSELAKTLSPYEAAVLEG